MYCIQLLSLYFSNLCAFYISSIPIGVKAIEWASEQSDVNLIEWPLLAADLGVETAQHVCLQRQHILRRNLVTYSSEVTDFLRFSKSMLSVMDVISYMPSSCNYIAPNVYASVIKCRNGVGNDTLYEDECMSYSELRPIRSSCRGRLNGVLVAQSRVVNLNTFKLVSNHPVRSFTYMDHPSVFNRTIFITNEYYRKPFAAIGNYINVVNHGTTCETTGSKEVVSIIHNLDIDGFGMDSYGQPTEPLTYTNGAEVRPIEIDLNSIISWKEEASHSINSRKEIPNRDHHKFVKKVNSKAKHNRKIIISLSTKPSRLKYVSAILGRLDLSKHDALIVINLPRKFGTEHLSYPNIPQALTANNRVVIKWLPEDLGPYSKILPTLRHLFYRATSNKIRDHPSSITRKLFGDVNSGDRIYIEGNTSEQRILLSKTRPRPSLGVDSYTEYESIKPYDAASAVVISIDDDTMYPTDLIKRMLVALNTVRFRAVVSICGVNITDWGLERSCGIPTDNGNGRKIVSTGCYPFTQKIERENHPLFAHFGDYTNRLLTPIDVFKGFTGVAYPMDIITRDLLVTIQKWRTYDILPIDKIRGFTSASCAKSDDLVLSASLHIHGVRRYRMTLNDDCREGLGQYDFGFKKDALQNEGGGHYKKYYTCIRTISANQMVEERPIFQQPKCPVLETIFSSTLAASNIPRFNWTMETLDTEHWPYLDYSNCISPPSTASESRKDVHGLSLRWTKDWRTKPSPNSYFLDCFYQTEFQPSQQWRCKFPPTMPSNEPVPVLTDTDISVVPIQLSFPDDRILGSPKPAKRLRQKKKEIIEVSNPLYKFTRNTYVGKLFGLMEPIIHPNRRRKLQELVGQSRKGQYPKMPSTPNAQFKSSKSSLQSSLNNMHAPVYKSPMKRRGNTNCLGGWDRIYPYADLCSGKFPMVGPLANDKRNMGFRDDSSNVSTVMLHNEGSNFYAIPYHTMKRFPKSFVANVQQRLHSIQRKLPGEFSTSIELLDLLEEKGESSTVTVVSSEHDLTKDCLKDAHQRLSEYALSSLTTTALANYVLKALNASDASSVLFISSSEDCNEYRASVERYKTQWYPSFGDPNLLPIPSMSEQSGRCQLIDSLFHGLRTLIRDHCVDYPKLDHLYFSHYGNSSVDSKILSVPSSHRQRSSYRQHTHPKHAYLWALHDDEFVDRDVQSISKRIDRHEFDVVIYADVFHREKSNRIYEDDEPGISSQFFWQKVSNVYPKSKIGFIDGVDKHDSSHPATLKVASQKGILFVKEIDYELLYPEVQVKNK